MELSSRDNALIKEMVRLTNDAKARKKSRRFVIEGARLCEDAALSGTVILAALATAEAQTRYASSWARVAETARAVYDIPHALARHLSDTDSPQGVFCLCETAAHPLFDIRSDGVYAALEDVQDPGNLGTILRTAEAFGVDGVLLSKGCCDLYNPKVLRASMGGVFRLPLAVCDDFVGTLRALGERLPVLASVVDGAALPITEAPQTGACIVVGNEGNGMSEAAVAACTARVTIPMDGRAESLNASMAAGIMLWELVRCRGKAVD